MRGGEVADRRIPDPDSQYRLRRCACGGEGMEYLLLRRGGTELWHVRCPDCGRRSREFPVRHDAQLDWNKDPAVAGRAKERQTWI